MRYQVALWQILPLFLALELTQAAALAQLPESDVANGDRFEAVLTDLQSRIETLETQNAVLVRQLSSQAVTELPVLSNNQATEPTAGDDISRVPPVDRVTTFDELLEFSERTEKRLSTIEEEFERAAELQDADVKKKKEKEATKEKTWFEKYTIRGYAQFRYNEPFSHGSPAQPQTVGDRSVSDNQSFLIRRARLILLGDVSEHLSLYFQPDFASDVPGSPDANQFAQIRDLYADVYLDDQKEYRFRIGQSKIPYGWENLQSSSNRLPLDRNDALNSAVRNERDLGIFFYWTPVEVQDIFKYINDEGLKGSGNYGLLGVGCYNGQGGSFREQNDDVHAVARVSLPFWLNECQLVEVGMQGFTGRYTVLSSTISPLGIGAPVRPTGTLETGNVNGIQDERLAWSFIYYPQPLGFQSEWTVGRGPALNDAQTQVTDSALYGGYAMVMYREQLRKGELIPFARWNRYHGGYKTERNAPFSEIEEWEMGVEWQFSKSLELVSMYTITDRTNTQAVSTAGANSYQQFEGELLRFQVQVTY